MNQNLTIKSWAEDDRPREKMLLKGRSALSDAELLAIILISGSREKTAVELAQELLSSCSNNLSKFAKLNFNDFTQFSGVGPAKAISIMAAMELGRRRKLVDMPKNKIIKGSQDVFDLMSGFFQDLAHEEFHILLLARSNEVIRTVQISKGGLAGTIADGKIIFKLALENSAAGIILSHNHPSGNLKPSEADLRLTKKISEFGKLIDLPVYDHLIFGDNNYFSFADHDMML